MVENSILDGTIKVSLHFPKDENVRNKILYRDKNNKIILRKILEKDGQYEVMIEFCGARCSDEYILISPYMFSVDENTMKESCDLELLYSIDNELKVRKIKAYSFQKTSKGIRVTYCLFDSTEEIELMKNSSFEINLILKKMIKQRWKKDV